MNKRGEQVRYQPLRVNALLSDGLIGVDRPSGDVEARAAQGLFRLAQTAGAIADDFAAAEGKAAGLRDALGGGPRPSEISGGVARPGTTAAGDVDASAPEDMTGRARYIRDGLVKRGLSPVAAAAAVGHGRQESLLRADGPDGDSGSASGIWQWRKERRDALKSFAATPGRSGDWRDVDTQMDFFVHELDTREAVARRGLANAQTVEQATEALMHFERPRDYSVRNPRAGHGWNSRLAYANWAASLGSEAPANGAAGAVNRMARGEGGTAPAAALPLIARGGGAANVEGVDADVVDRFASLQGQFGRQLPINSGYRSRSYNKRVGGADHSQHIHGKALDVDVSSLSEDERKQLIGMASAAGFTGIGVYRNSLHLDTGPRRAWGPSYGAASVPAWAQESVTAHLAGAPVTVGAGGGPAVASAPAMEPFGVSAAPGGFRPTGGWTIRDRAYDEAGTRTYLQQLDTTMRADMDEVYRRFRDDPAKLGEAFEALRQVHQDEHVFPEIAADYDAAFGQMASSYNRQALADADRREEQRQFADFLSRTSELETRTAQSVATFDASTDAGAAVLSSQAALDAHYDDAVRRGVIDPAEAEKAKIASRRQTAVAFYGRQAEALQSPEEIEGLIETMRKDFGAGELEGVDGPGWTELETSMKRLADSRRSEGRVAAASLKDRGESIARRMVNGFEVDQAEIGRLMLDARTAPGGQAIVDTAMERIAAARILREKNIGEADAYVRGLEKDVKAVEDGTAEWARRELDRIGAAVTKDPLGVAVEKGILPPEAEPLIAPGEAEAVAGRFAQRVIQAEAAAGHFGVAPKYLRPGEAAALQKLVETDPDAAAQIAGGLLTGAREKSAAILAELADDAPAITQAGVIVAGGGSDQAAADVLAGYGKGTDGKALPAALKRDEQSATVSATFGQAFAGSPRDATRTVAAAEAIAKARIARLGVPPESEAAKGVFERALQEAVGATFEGGVQFGGIVELSIGGYFGMGATRPRVIVVPGIRADRFGELIQSIRDEDISGAPDGKTSRRGPRYMSGRPMREDGTPYTAADIKAATPVAVAGGYRFAFGDPASEDPQWVRDENGEPWRLGLESMRPLLEARVPGAYR